MESAIPPVFLALHAHIHSATTPGVPSVEDRIVAGLTEAQLRQRVDHHDSIVWLLWHIARVEDFMINTCVRGVEQVFDRGGWQARLGVSRRDIGTGMTAEQVAQFSAQVDVAAVRAYRAAVAHETRTGLTARDFDDLDKPVAGAGERAAASGDLGSGAEYIPDMVRTRPRWFLFCSEGIGHSYEHLALAEHVARLLGRTGR
jgi:DinB family protein